MLASASRSLLRARPLVATPLRPQAFTAVRYSSGHAEETFEAFNARYETFFKSVTDLFELQRGLNNAFAYDLVPSTEVISAALQASRKVNDYATAVRILEGVKEKVENVGQYKAYLAELEPTIKELGIVTSEGLYNQTL
ncbi:cytochrome c oxidase subunit 5a [Cryptococcus wingfieldii CBS 7118]|uniref:Cytochrome c oxidase subunit 6, mitochondrial n=1 Tax=Cryptococcus wingfieldii CBS 7118 TaxID=1295528 RepID=A0A1E3JCI1_9TREE|nr:cytochrome c oxidase subunit 5a [Cryptococcus wingfieldii CBS 7118]ODN98395.1 cytochrome c oxidase subunit 5a [Cryptococcus wingfieldii CBS 7118]